MKPNERFKSSKVAFSASCVVTDSYSWSISSVYAIN